MNTVVDTVACIALGWERAAAIYRDDAARYRDDGNTVMAAVCDTQAEANERHAAQLRDSVPLP
jgi:hypothetical protein